MASHSLPSPTWNSRAVSDTELEQLFHPQAGDGLVGSPADTDLVYADNSGMNVKIRANRYAIVRGRLYDSGTSDITKTITANASGLTRIDLVVLRLTRATSAITEEVKAGTPGSGAPAATTDLGTTGVYEIPLATVTVPSGDTAIGSSQVTAAGWYLGEQMMVCTSTTRPPHRPGLIIWETDTSKALLSTGAAPWRVISDNGGTVAVTAAVGWDLTGCTTERVDGQVTARIRARLTGGNITALPVTIGSIAAGFRPTANLDPAAHVHGTSGIRPIVLTINTGGALVASIANPIYTGDTIYGSVTYPAAA